MRLAHIPDPKEYYCVEKMKFTKKQDKKTVVYNKNITIIYVLKDEPDWHTENLMKPFYFD